MANQSLDAPPLQERAECCTRLTAARHTFRSPPLDLHGVTHIHILHRVSDEQKDPNAYTFHAFDQQEKTKSEWPSTANPSSGLQPLSPTHHSLLKDALKFIEDASELGYRMLMLQEHAPSTLSQLHAPLALLLGMPYSRMEDDVGLVGEGGGRGGGGEVMVELEDWLLNRH
ncbi:hypothetical protein EI94DRAFT_1699859 [Lactarius quietus]|nr:hypothetical protein EI94DRAFT_1699859 [Lactarius quietus]